jgi:lysozyme
MKPKPDPNMPWAIPLAAVELIADAEGLSLVAYRCLAGKLTCGWGETDGITADTVWTKEVADRRLCEALEQYAGRVNALCTDAPTASELGAMVSLAYNVGLGAFAKSSVLRAHNRGDAQAASRAFGLWNKARVNGVLQPIPGLTARRAAEAALYLHSDAPTGTMPQAVDGESSLGASPMAQSGAVTAGVGVTAILAQLGDYTGEAGKLLAQARTIVVDTLGLPGGLLVPLVLIAAGGAVIYWRRKQRRDGWA